MYNEIRTMFFFISYQQSENALRINFQSCFLFEKQKYFKVAFILKKF